MELGCTDMGLMMFESGICVECDAPFEHCMCDPCQHGYGRKDHCIFCQGELVVEEVTDNDTLRTDC